MQNKMRLMAIPFVMALGACSSANDAVDALQDLGDALTGSVDIVSVSGNSTDVSGNWQTGCYDMGGAETKEELIFTLQAVEYTNNSYSSTDGTCTGTATLNMSYSATVEMATSSDAIGWWQDGTGATVAPPAAADGSGSLSDTESFTDLTYTFTAISGIGGVAVGDAFHFFYILDDTAANTSILYRGQYTDEVALTGAYGQFFDFFTKQ